MMTKMLKRGNRVSRPVKTGAAAGGIGLVIRLSARCISGFADRYVKATRTFWVNTLGRFSSLFPFSCAEILLYLLTVAAAVCVCRMIFLAVRRKQEMVHFVKTMLSVVLCLAGICFFLYENGEDVPFYIASFAETYGFRRGEYSTEELEEVCRTLAELCSEAAEQVNRDENGVMVITDRCEDRVRAAVAGLSEQFPEFSGYVPRPKGVLNSKLMSLVGFAGIWTAFTEEANYNRDMTPYNIPFSMAHELSHAKGILREDEANFTAFLACISSEDPEIFYSGCVSAWVYCGNELWRRDRDAWEAAAQLLDERVSVDLSANNAFWKQFETPAAEITESINDSYLKSKGAEGGTQSYEEVVDLIVSRYREWKNPGTGF